MATTLVWLVLVSPAAAQPADDQTLTPSPSSIESEPPDDSALASNPASIPASPGDAAVSTSPAALRESVDPSPAALSPGDVTTELGIRGDGVALTRAAAQRRVDTMSPIGWLSRYGAVRIAHPD